MRLSKQMVRSTLRLTAFVCLGLAASRAWAGGGPQNVAIVVNADSWASKTVANEYMALRNISPSHVIYLSGIPSFETVSLAQFRELILKPTLEQLNARGLAPQIDVIAYSTDFPYAVSAQQEVRAAQVNLPRILTPTASLNGATYLYQFVLAESLSFLSLESNGYYRRSLRSSDAVPWTPEETERYQRAMAMLEEKRHSEAEPLLRATIDSHPHFDQALYNLACVLALTNRADESLQMLNRAAESGWADGDHTQHDPDLAILRERAEFKALIEQMNEPRVYESQATAAFSSQDAWTMLGERAPDGRGVRYVLSTMLAYTAGRGTSVRDAIEGLRRSVAADCSRPDGTFFFMTNTDVRSTTRKWGFETAVQRLRGAGLKAAVETGRLPQGGSPIAGLLTGTPMFDASAHTILPGAICEHLTSFGGVMREDAGQTCLSRFLEAGAAGASGTVVEPFAIQAKFPDPMIHVHYALGCSLAEAFYQSVAGPYQLLIVGDPLCRPWAIVPQVHVDGVRPGQVVRGQIELRPETIGGGGPEVLRFEVFVDGFRLAQGAPGESIVLDTVDWNDGMHVIEVVGIADTAAAEQGNAVIPVHVNNRDRRVDLRIAGNVTIDLDQTIKVSARANGGKAIRVECNGVVLARAESDRADFMIDALPLGLGPVRLYAVGEYDDPESRSAVSDFADVRIEPRVHEPVRAYQGLRLERGFTIAPEGDAPRYVQELNPDNWLELSGVMRGQSFEFDAFFDAREDDLYQIQVDTPHAVRVLLNDVPVYEAPASPGGQRRWHYVPAMLRTGTHRLRIECSVSGPPRLDVRLGASGTRQVRGSDFLHVLDGPG